MYIDEKWVRRVHSAYSLGASHYWTRRQWLRVAAAAPAVFAVGGAAWAIEGEQLELSGEPGYLLRPKWEEGAALRFRAVLEVEGQVRWRPEKKDQQQAPFKAHGDLIYTERLLENPPGGPRRSARYYDQAEVEFQIGKQVQKRTILDQQRLILVQFDQGAPQLTCPAQPMTRDELDLLDVPASSLMLDQILPADPVRVGQPWHPSAEAVRALLGLDEVTETTFAGELRQVEGELAQLEFQGAVSGVIQGAKTEIRLTAKSNVHLPSKRLNWFTMAMREQREIGDAQPGLEAAARLRLIAEECSVPESLNDEVIASLPSADSLDYQVLRFIADEGGYEMLMDRRWRVIVDRHDVTILRLFEQGSLVAQAVVSPLLDAPPEKDISLATFESEVKESLVKHAGQIIESAEGTGNNGLRVLRVTAAGVVSEVSMQWVYYHISNPQGRRIAFTFTVQTDLVEQFAVRDRAMIETFAFRPVSDKPRAKESIEAAEKSPSNRSARGTTTKR